MKRYEDLNPLEIDTLREIGSIGTGNAATALSEVLSQQIKMTLPQVTIMGYNEAIKAQGGAENIVAGVLVAMSGEINGMMLFIQRIEFINVVMESVLSKKIDDYSQLGELEMSAVVEIGNIIISSYVSAISKLTGLTVNLSVPSVSVNMLGAIMSVPMVEYGHQTDKIMALDGKFVCNKKEVTSSLLMLPEIESLNHLLQRLGVDNG